MKTRFEAEPSRRLLRCLAVERDLSLGELAELLRLDRCTLHRLQHRDWLRSDTADGSPSPPAGTPQRSGPTTTPPATFPGGTHEQDHRPQLPDG
jgi:hypothetical protein